MSILEQISALEQAAIEYGAMIGHALWTNEQRLIALKKMNEARKDLEVGTEKLWMI